MGIFADNPVLNREVRSRLRLRRLVAGSPLLWGAAVGVLIIIYFYIKGLVAIWHGQVRDARDLWAYLILFLLLLIIVIAPALLSTAITQEREQQTWESLATTQLTAAEILIGKWLARLSLTGLPIFVLLPFVIGCAAKGEIGVRTNLAVLLFLCITAAFYGVLGLLCSFFARKTVTATVVSLTVTIILCVGTPLLAALLESYLRASSADYAYHDPIVLWINPFSALYALIADLEPQGIGMIASSSTASPGTATAFYLSVSAIAAAAGLLTMTARFRHVARE